MGLARFLGRRAGQLKRKYIDLLSTTGSRRRALLYVSKFIILKVGFLIRHLALSVRYRHFGRDVARYRSDAPDTPLIAIKLTGGMGDMIVAARYLRDLLAAAGPFQFDLYCPNPGLTWWVFGALPECRTVHSELIFDRIRKHYVTALWVSQFVIVYEPPAMWTELRQHRNLLAVLQRIVAFRPEIDEIVAAHPDLDGRLSDKAVAMTFRRADFLHGMSRIPYGGDTYPLAVADGMPQRHGLTPGSYLTIHNGFDLAFVITARSATKCYPSFAEVLALLKARLPHLKIVQIGAGTSTPIVGVDINLVNNLSIQESAGLIAHSLLHIDNEGGLVHLARCLGVRSCVVFGPTPIDYFAYPGNVNLPPNFCGGCWWSNQTWMDQCPRGFPDAACMTSHAPQDVAAAIVDAIAAARAGAAPPQIRDDRHAVAQSSGLALP